MFGLKSILLISYAAGILAAAVPNGLNNMNSLTKRDCDCAQAIKCLDGCGAFNNGAGQGGGFCALGCYDANGCGTNTLCCEDGTNCEGSGCCAGHEA